MSYSSRIIKQNKIKEQEVVFISDTYIAIQKCKFVKESCILEVKCLHFYGSVGLELIEVMRFGRFGIRDNINKSMKVNNLKYEEVQPIICRNCPFNLVCNDQSIFYQLKTSKICRTYKYTDTKQLHIRFLKEKSNLINVKINNPLKIYNECQIQLSEKKHDVINNKPPLNLDKRKYNIPSDSEENGSGDNMEKVEEELKNKNRNYLSKRHRTKNKVLHVEMVKLLKCNNLTAMYDVLAKMQTSNTTYRNYPLSSGNFKIKNSKISQTVLQTKKMKKQTFSQVKSRILTDRMGFSCDLLNSCDTGFKYRYFFHFNQKDDLLMDLYSNMHKLKLENHIHCRIIVKVNDYLINEFDDKYSRFIIECQVKSQLVYVLDLINSVFPQWSIWSNGLMDVKQIQGHHKHKRHRVF